jgi:hypothetical protein
MMTYRFEFVVVYEEKVMRAAAKRYLFRTLFASHGVQSAMVYFWVMLSAVAVVFFRMWTFEAGLVWGVVGATAAALAIYSYASLSGARSSVAAMKRGDATFRLAEDNMSIELEYGVLIVDWKSIVEVMRADRFWILHRARRQGITLPLAGVPRGALDFIAAKTTAVA